ncbi:MAG: YggT family protein [Bacteroidales bacterium]|nr:YggT family protein [Bacteroidales bacterium]HHY15605.1 YggT family protein [Bacillota bacterium]
MLLVSLFDALFNVYNWLLVARFLLSWVPNVDYYHPVVKFLHKATDPVVRLFRGIIPPYGNIDFSPIILFLVLRLVYPLLRGLLIQLVMMF